MRGSSDDGFTVHIEAIAAACGKVVEITNPRLDRLRQPPGRAVIDKLRAVQAFNRPYDLLVIHRDADGPDPEPRRNEIADAVHAVMPSVPFVALVPVRMTESLLLLDEADIRTVAGNPNGRSPLELPKPREVEGIRDPKTYLKEILATASGDSGRRLQRLRQRFPEHRRQLLERLDTFGRRIREVPCWDRFVRELETLFWEL